MGGRGPVSLKEFINEFGFPVVLVNSNVELIDANQEALRFVGKDLDQIKGQLGGEVLECIYAAEPGGCGNTVCCKACTIRNSVNSTHHTGKPLVDVDAYQDIMTKDGLRRVHLKISTVKSADSVLLKIVTA